MYRHGAVGWDADVGWIERLDRHNQRVLEDENGPAKGASPPRASKVRAAALAFAVAGNLFVVIGLVAVTIRGNWTSAVILLVLLTVGASVVAASWIAGRQ